MTLDIRVATYDDLAAWNGFLFEQGGTPPFSDFRWKKVLEDVFGVEPHFLIAADTEGTVEGVLPVYVTKSLRGRRRLFSLNRGLIASSPQVEAALINWIRERQQKYSWSEAVISSRQEPLSEFGKTSTKSAVILPLSDDLDNTWTGLRAKSRNMIRKAEKVGLVEEKGFHNLRAFYEIYASRMLSMGVPIYGFSLFKAIAEIFSADAELIVAKHGGEIASGIFLIYGSHTAAYPFQATGTRHMGTAATQFLIWKAVESATARGIRTIDMGESQPQSPVYKSKINFGGIPEPSYYLTLRGTPQSPQSTLAGSSASTRPPQQTPGTVSKGIDLVMNRSPTFIRRPAGLWLKRQGRLLF